MPSIETFQRFQKAVLWEARGFDAYGQPTVSATPVELDVRWVTKKGQNLRAKGNTSSADSNLVDIDATAVVDRVIKVGSTMWLGELTAWYGSGSDTNDDEVMEVKRCRVTPDLKNRFTRWVVELAKYKDTLPTQV